jgi:hypothetical protein
MILNIIYNKLSVVSFSINETVVEVEEEETEEARNEEVVLLTNKSI